jgi:hypothetical protein
MGKEFSVIDNDLAAWVDRQQMFFVATAPLAADGLVNCSPKGRDTLRITGPREVVYLDLGGSGIETVAHVKQNGRIVIMLCAFEGPPRIVRFHGRGEVIEPAAAGFETLLQVFPPPPSPARSLIRIQVRRISDSCGFGVPRYDYLGQRSSIENYVRDKHPDELEAYKAEHNRKSLDGLPGLDI